MSIQNNRGYNNIEDTGQLLTRNKRAGAAKIIVIVLVVLIILALIITGIYFFLLRNKKDAASETITADEIKGTYYSLYYYEDDLEFEYPYMVDIKEDTIKSYCSVDPMDSFQVYYRLRDEDKRTLVDITEEKDSYYSTLAYYKDLGILWIGGEELFVMFRENDRRYDYAMSFMKRYYSDNDSADRYFRGKWRDIEDSNNSFEFTGNSVSNITVSDFNWDHIDMTKDSEQYSDYVNDVGYTIEERKIIKHNDDGSTTFSTQCRLNLVPVSDDECLAYYCDYTKDKHAINGRGAIFERVSD